MLNKQIAARRIIHLQWFHESIEASATTRVQDDTKCLADAIEAYLLLLNEKPHIDITLLSIITIIKTSPDILFSKLGCTTGTGREAVNKLRDLVRGNSEIFWQLNDNQRKHYYLVFDASYTEMAIRRCLSLLNEKLYEDIDPDTIARKTGLSLDALSAELKCNNTEEIMDKLRELITNDERTFGQLNAAQQANLGLVDGADCLAAVLKAYIHRLNTTMHADLSLTVVLFDVKANSGVVCRRLGCANDRDALDKIRKLVRDNSETYEQLNDIQKRHIDITDEIDPKIDYAEKAIENYLFLLKETPHRDIKPETIAQNSGVGCCRLARLLGCEYTEEITDKLRELVVNDEKTSGQLNAAQQKNISLVDETDYAACAADNYTLQLEKAPAGNIDTWLIANSLGINMWTLYRKLKCNTREECRDTLYKIVKADYAAGKRKLTATQYSHLMSDAPNVQLGNSNDEAGETELTETPPGDLIPPPDVQLSEYELLKMKLNLYHSSTGIDLLDFTVSCTLNGRELTAAEIKEIIESDTEFIRLADGTFIRVSKAEQEYLQKYLQGRQGKIPVNKVHTLLGLEKMEIEAPPDLQDFCRQIQDIGNIPQIPLPKNLVPGITPLGYQKTGYYWLYWLYNQPNIKGGILADDMGLGKTLQAIMLLAKLKEGGLLKPPALVVAPKSVKIDAWMEENIHKFAPDLNVLYMSASKSERLEKLQNMENYDLIVTSYGVFKEDIDTYANLKFSYAILDEAQNIKNHETLNWQNAKRIQAEHHLAITGTPVETKLLDLQSIFDWVMPGFLSKAYINSINLEGSEDIAALRKYISPYILRRRKNVLNLPPKTEIVEKFDLLPGQYQLYKEIIESYRRKMDGATELTVLKVINQLTQLCDHPALIKPYTTTSTIVESAKFNRFKELITEIIQKGEKVVVFSRYVKMLEIIEHYFQENGIKSVRISGAVNDKDRKAAIKEFQESSDVPVFLGSLRACGQGITLTAAHHVIKFEPWYNPGVESQSEDRVWRYGQTEEVMVYHLLTNGTLEEQIYNLQKSRKALADIVLPQDSADGKEFYKESGSNFEELQKILSIEVAGISQKDGANKIPVSSSSLPEQ